MEDQNDNPKERESLLNCQIGAEFVPKLNQLVGHWQWLTPDRRITKRMVIERLIETEYESLRSKD